MPARTRSRLVSWPRCLLLSWACILAGALGCGGASTTETQDEPVAETSESPESGASDSTQPEEPDSTQPDAGPGSTEEPEPEPPPVPAMLADCDARAEAQGGRVSVIFQCEEQLVSYYDSSRRVAHEVVLEPLMETPGFSVEAERHSIQLQGERHPASILYHTDELEDIVVFAVYVVTQDLPDGGTRVINCFMLPDPEQVAWCDQAVRAISAVGQAGSSSSAL